METLAAANGRLRLNQETMHRIDPRIRRPGYARADLSPGILHIGLGNFHRAHQAVYLDDLFNTGRDLDWGLVGSGLMPFDAERRRAMEPQDWLYSVVSLAPGQLDARIIGALTDVCEARPDAIIARMADPAIRIVTLTITEGGYFIDAATGGFDAGHPAILEDAVRPAAPRTVFGVLLAGLKLRRDRGLPPPAILSCDNIEGNGRVARAAVEGLAELVAPELADWVRGNVAFPNAMVDRITPAVTDTERNLVAEEFGLLDAVPVVCEPFRQWVLEDNFPLGRPGLEDVGAQFVSDVTPHETMKLRILNAGHAAIAYPAALMGHTHVHEAMSDPDITNWLKTLIRREVIPVLPPVEGEDFDAYLVTCAERFSNPRVRDTIARLCQDGSNRQPKFILPTISEALEAGRNIEGLALEVAFWCLHCASKTPLDDPRAAALADAARATRAEPRAFLNLTDIFGTLAASTAFSDAFSRHITALWQSPPRAVLRAYLEAQLG